MSSEQRIEALEKKVANLTLPNGKTEELAKMMRDVAAETIKNGRCPGGALRNKDEKAALGNTAYSVSLGINCRQ